MIAAEEEYRMASCATDSTIDVAIWLLDRASAEDSYLQPQKLQRLLYLAQGYYAREYYGRKLMPATFIVHDMGPVEPTVFRLFEAGRPQIGFVAPPAEVKTFLEIVWRRFGGHTVDRLNALIGGQALYRETSSRGQGEEIPFDEMAAAFASKDDAAETVRTPDGRAVKKWMPSRSVRRNAP